MRFIEEIVIEEFLPTFRSMLAEALKERGLTQREIADIMGISQSAVSKHLKGRVTQYDAIRTHERVQATVERISDGLASGEISRMQALVETEVLIRELEAPDQLLAQRHETQMPELAACNDEFRIHDPESSLLERERVLSSISRGIRILETTTGTADLIPNVGSNLVQYRPPAEGIDDVAGIPGRIFDVQGQLTVPAEPEFGASQHVARVLLAARAQGHEATAALNLRYDSRLISQLEALGHTPVEFETDTEIEDALATALDQRLDADVLYQTGDIGLEPIVYVLDDNAETATVAVRELCRRLHGQTVTAGPVGQDYSRTSH